MHAAGVRRFACVDQWKGIARAANRSRRFANALKLLKLNILQSKTCRKAQWIGASCHERQHDSGP
jgi:hypothetical protein